MTSSKYISKEERARRKELKRQEAVSLIDPLLDRPGRNLDAPFQDYCDRIAKVKEVVGTDTEAYWLERASEKLEVYERRAQFHLQFIREQFETIANGKLPTES